MSAADPFEVLGIAPRYGLSASELRARWMRAAAAAHPDADGGVESSAAVNAAYHELADPLRRAAALLRRLDAPPVADPGLPPAFLLEAMEIREEVDAAKGDRAALDAIRDAIQGRHREALDGIAAAFADIVGAPDEAVARRVLVGVNLARALARILEQIDQETGQA